MRIGDSILHQNKDINRQEFYHPDIEILDSLYRRFLQNLPQYMDNLQQLVEKSQKISKILIPVKFRWQEGDLLYGINTDRKSLARSQRMETYFNIGDMRPFSQWEDPSQGMLPRIVDQYNDVIRDPEIYIQEIQQDNLYSKYLQEFYKFTISHPEYLEPSGKIPKDLTTKEDLETLWSMCLAGIKFFTRKGHIIHFVIDKYNPKINQATRKEIQFIKRNWDDEDLKSKIKFYRLQPFLHLIDPEKENWFE